MAALPNNREEAGITSITYTIDASKLEGQNASSYLARYLSTLQTGIESTSVVSCHVAGLCIHLLPTSLTTPSSVSSQSHLTSIKPALLDTLHSIWLTGGAGSNGTHAILCAGRLIRRSLGRVYVLIFSRTEGQGLFDAVSQWLKAIQEPKLGIETRM